MARYQLRIDPDGELVEVWDQQGKLIGYMRDEAVGSNGVMAMLRAGKKMEVDLGEGVGYDDVDWRSPGQGLGCRVRRRRTRADRGSRRDCATGVGRNAKKQLWPELKETHE
jgi:hypothetical protein